MASIKSALQFGLVYIPITLTKCSKNTDIGFNLLYKKTGERIKYKKTCENCPANIPQEDIVKGYQYEKDKYIVLDNKELEKLKTPKEKNIEILSFVNLTEIEPIYFIESYFVEPTGAENAYSLLVKALSSEKKVGIAKSVLGTKESLIALRSEKDRLIVTTLHFADEIVKTPSPALKQVNKQELELAKTLIGNMTAEFNIEAYKNEYKEKVLKAIEDKIAGKRIKAIKVEKPKTIANLIMDALKMSVKETEVKEKKKRA